MPTLSIRTWFTIAGVCGLLALAGFVYYKMNAHFKHVHQIEADNKSLKDQNSRLNSRVIELGKVNTENKRIYDESLKQERIARGIAEQERQAAEKRATRYRSIRDDAKNTPPADRRPVGPAVQSTVDRLWN